MRSPLRLRVERSCHEPWDGMAPTGTGRYCDGCRRAVLDLTGRGAREALGLIALHGDRGEEGRLCARIDADADGWARFAEGEGRLARREAPRGLRLSVLRPGALGLALGVAACAAPGRALPPASGGAESGHAMPAAGTAPGHAMPAVGAAPGQAMPAAGPVPGATAQAPGGAAAAQAPGGAQAHAVPVDSDGDGVPDEQDRCPRQPGVAEREGCPHVGVIVGGARVEIRDKVYFAPRSARVRPESAPLLDAIAEALRRNPQLARVEVRGAREAREPADLGRRRAAVVIDELRRRGIDGARLVPGEADAETPPAADPAQRRRVELRVADPGPCPPGAAPG